MDTWAWITVGLSLPAFIIGTRVLLLELRFKRTENTAGYYKRWLVSHTSRAKEDLRIVSNFLCPCVFDDATGDIRKKLSSNPRLRVRILTGPVIYRDGEANQLYELAREDNFGGRIELRVLADGPSQDFIIVDNRHAFICQRSNPTPRPGGFVTTLESNPSYSKEFNQRFDRMWEKSESISSSSITFAAYSTNTESGQATIERD